MLNKVFLIGNVGRDPELRHTANGVAICNISVATKESWYKDGEKNEKTEWHRVVGFGKVAEICGEHLRKGDLVHIDGKLQTRQWEKDGKKNYTTEVVINEIKMLGWKTDKKYKTNETPMPTITDDDIPF